MPQKLPIGIQSFESLRKDGYLYVDKTSFLYALANSGKYFFLARPRRFGKSLFLSTLKAYFEGKKDLFEGLAVARLETEWKAYPVLYIDLNAGIYDTYEGLVNVLDSYLTAWEQLYGITRSANDIVQRFKNIILNVTKISGGKAIILIDEYDKPLLQTIDKPRLQERYRMLLKAFYGNLKTCDENIRFALLTGVTKFSHISIFSDLNNLQDISLDECYAEVCGLTTDEIRQNFGPFLEAFANKEGISVTGIMDQLQQMYDGYHFSEDMTKGVYNPFSLLNALAKKKFSNFWFETGTPSFLTKIIQDYQIHIQDFSNGDIVASDLRGKESLLNEPFALFYQSGYLTIKGYDKEFDSYRLGFPNKEVEQSFLNFLLPRYVGTTDNQSAFYIENFVRDLRKGDIDSFMERMKAFFADTPYELIRDMENHYQNVMFTVCRLMGYYTVAEYHTSHGRIDMTVKTSDYAYVFEFKFNKSAEEALAQIDAKYYGLPFVADNRKLVKIGVNFSGKTRNIDQYLIV